MRELNIKYQEKYKEVDKFIKDAYSSEDGITNYINLMTDSNEDGKKYVNNWEFSLKKLKHCRWIRNKLAHEVEIDSDICEEEDFEWLCLFEDLLNKAEDPLSELDHKAKQIEANEKRKEAQEEKAKKEERKKSTKGFIWFIVLFIIAILFALFCWYINK